jgi:hypothetical protein
MSLKRALESATNLAYPPDCHEIIVVDNGSADATAALVEETRKNHPACRLRYVREERLGLHHARHAGVWAAKGDILIFTDDDATFERDWLRAYAEAFASHREMVAAGGPVRASWDIPPPNWLIEFMGDAKTFGILSLMQPYDDFHLATDGVFFGVNMAIRADVLLKMGGFNPEAIGEVWLGDGETGLMFKLWKEKMLIGYVPDALVYHHIPPERMTVQYLCRRMRNQGISDLYSDFQCTGLNMRSLLKRATGLLVRNSHEWLIAMMVRGRTDARSLNIQLDAARTQAQLKYTVKCTFNRKFRAFVLKNDWLKDSCPPAQQQATAHIGKRG